MTQSEFRLLLLRFALLPFLCLCAFVGLISLQLHQITAMRNYTARATSIVLQCDKLLNTLVDEETGVRGYVISQDRSYLEPYQSAVGRVDGELQGLSDIVAGDARLESEVQAVRLDFSHFTQANANLVKAEDQQSSIVEMLRLQKQGMDGLRGRLGLLASESQLIRDEGRKKLNVMYAALPLYAVGGGLLVAFFVIFDGFMQFRRISRVFSGQIAEIEVQRSSLHTTLQSIGDAVVVCDAKGVITLFNPTAEQVTGWSSGEAIGQLLNTVFNIVNESTRQVVESPVDKVLKTGQIVGLANHTVLIRKDRSEVAIDDSGAPIRDDKQAIVGVVLVFRDIQARRVAERELALRTAELESLFLTSPAGFATFDREHRFLRVNQVLTSVDGISVEDHLGRKLEEILPEAAESLGPVIDRVFREGKTVETEYLLPAVESAEAGAGVDLQLARQWLMWFYPIVLDESQEPVRTGVIALDTTERWHAQEALVRTEKLVAVGRLAASIAHEMNNPLTSVTNLLYLIACDATLNETTRAYVDRANIELDRVSRMATQTLRFARRSMAPGVVDVEDVLNGIVLLFSGRLSHAQVQVKQRKRKFSPYFGYSSEVVQLLSNLVGNALDAVESSGTITVAIQDGHDWKTGNAGIVITVADSGPGISEAVRKKIWEPFFTTKAETGTGLGLWLVEETVRKNDGTIRMRSATGAERHGTVFRLVLPFEADKKSKGEPALG